MMTNKVGLNNNFGRRITANFIQTIVLGQCRGEVGDDTDCFELLCKLETNR